MAKAKTKTEMSWLSRVFELATKVKNPLSLAAFAIAAIVAILLIVSSSGAVPLAVWMLLGTIVGVATFAPVFVELLRSREKHRAIYRVRVTVIDPQQRPVDDARVWSSMGGEVKSVAGGCQFDIPAASRPADGKLTVYAAKEAAFLTGKHELQLGSDFSPTLTIQMAKSAAVSVRGIILDDAGRALPDVRVSVTGYAADAVTTHSDGNFVLPAHAAEGEQVLLHAEKRGYHPVTQYHPAGDEPVTIVLARP